jgi:hypothetical protein
LAPHVYYADLDPLRQALHTDYALSAARARGRPVLLEEFGCSSSQAGEPEQAAYYRDSILAALGLGAVGAIGWCATDFEPATVGAEPPYSHHAFELGFGVTRADGSEKPVCAELRALRALIDEIGPGAERPPARVALLRPRYLDEQLPFSFEDREALARTQLQAYVLACQAGLDPDVVPEGARELDGYALVLCPAVQKLLTPTWRALARAAEGGATLYWSYFSGDHTFHQGAWCPDFTGLTGLTHRLRYGCFDLPPAALSFSGELSLMLPTGIDHSPRPQSLAYLPVTPGGGVRTRLVTHAGPALLERALGRGRVLFSPYPIERYLANLVDGSARGAHRLYRLIAEIAGVDPPYVTGHPDVQRRVLALGHDDLVVVQHRGWTPEVDDSTDLPREAERLYDRGARGEALGPKAARVYRVRGVR